MIDAILYSRPVGRLALRPAVALGYRQFRRSGRTPRWAYRAMRKLFAADPAGFERLAQASTAEHAKLQGLDSATGIAAGALDDALAALRRDGLYVLPRRLPEGLCAELEQAALEAECSVINAQGRVPTRARFDPRHPAGIRMDLREEDVLRCGAVQRLLADETLLSVAQAYLGAAPIQDMVAMWWSAAGGASAPASSATSEAAQLYHFDLDRLRFLKVFVYLTDVDDRTGPHGFVRGSHRDLPSDFRRDRRYADDEVHRRFGDAAITVGGSRGTVFLADTRALHKGVPLVEGHRLVFQIEYATSLFGQDVTRPAIAHADDALESVRRRYPQTFTRFVAAPVDG
jgi:hypothetical protein